MPSHEFAVLLLSYLELLLTNKYTALRHQLLLS